MLAAASYFDLRKREVKDTLWVVFAVAAGIIYVFDFPASFDEGIKIMVSMTLTAAIAYGIYKSGLFGGADMLALITLSGLVPLYFGNPLSGSSGAAFHGFAPIIVLTNAIVLSVTQVIFNIIRNLVYYSKHSVTLFEGLQHEPILNKIFAVMVGHRSTNPQYAFPIERTVNGRRKFDFALKPAETAEYEIRNDVWVTSGIPFLIYFTVGFVMMIIVGDILALLFGGLLLN
jgi:preflagellin peptidase FlaK